MTETYPPGNPQGIWEIADNLDGRAKVLTSASEQLAALRKIPWFSDAGDAYRAHVTKRCATMDDNAADIGKAANVLRAFGKLLLDLQREHAELEQKRATLEKAISEAASPAASTDPDPTVAASMALTIGKQADIQLRWQEAVEQATADIKTLDLYPADDTNLGLAPTFIFPWDDHFPPNRHLDYDILENGSFDPADIQQGRIGDCYLLSALMGFLRTKDGQQMIRDSVRWDSSKRGYWVTLYIDGEAKEYFVNQAFDMGAVEEDWEAGPFSGERPGIAAIYESAVYQAIGYEDLNDGGTPEEAMKLITGDPNSKFYYRDQHGSLDKYLFQAEWKLNDGAAVSLGTLPEEQFPDGEDRAELSVKREVDGKTVTEKVELVAKHAYMVERIDDNGIWIRNPHGTGNGADGGGAFQISKEDYAKYFNSLSISGGVS